MKKKLFTALTDIKTKLLAMNDEEFNKLIEKHKDGHYAQILNDINYSFDEKKDNVISTMKIESFKDFEILTNNSNWNNLAKVDYSQSYKIIDNFKYELQNSEEIKIDNKTSTIGENKWENQAA